MTEPFEIRDAVHGFVSLNDWEKEIINHPVFQRLRRIRQLGLTEMVYPGAVHSRFEHSLGVLHVASRMFDMIVQRRGDFLKSELGYKEAGLDKARTLVRLSTLLHDVGHAPFSHGTEELMPVQQDSGKPYKHEQYTAAIVRFKMRDVIENHKLNKLNYNITADDVAAFIEGAPVSSIASHLLWRDLIAGQIDADRADYLLRDAYHIGVAYGKYDLDRLIYTLSVALDPESQGPIIAIDKSGLHVAEALILARFMMFTQVYFHHTRRAFDHHITNAMKHLLSGAQACSDLDRKDAFPPPTSLGNIEAYLAWDDWRVLGHVHRGEAGEHGEIIRCRNHYRCVWSTAETPTMEELDFVGEFGEELRCECIQCFVDTAENSWYTPLDKEIRIHTLPDHSRESVDPLSRLSSVVQHLQSIKQVRIFVPADANAKKRAVEIRERLENGRRKPR